MNFFRIFIHLKIFFSRILNLPLIIINGFLCVVFLKKYTGILPNHSLGVCIYYAENIISFAKKNNILLSDITIYTKSEIEDCNQTIVELYSRKIRIVRSRFIYSALRNGGIEALSLARKGIPKFITGKRYYSIIGKEVNLAFTRQEAIRGWKLLSNLGIKEHDRVALVSSRSSDYWISRGGSSIDSEVLRNSKFEDLSEAIKELNKLGYKVIRLGQYSDREHKKNYLSLNTFNQKDRDFIDVFLHSIASLVISGNSGLAYLSACFGKPTLIHNMFPLSELPTIYRTLAIPKTIVDKSTKKILTFHRYLNYKKLVINYDEYIFPRLCFLDAMSIREPTFFKKNNLLVLDNTKIDIVNGINELLNYDEINQEECQKYYLFGSSKYRLLGDFGGVISPSYLLRYNNEIL